MSEPASINTEHEQDDIYLYDPEIAVKDEMISESLEGDSTVLDELIPQSSAEPSNIQENSTFDFGALFWVLPENWHRTQGWFVRCCCLPLCPCFVPSPTLGQNWRRFIRTFTCWFVLIQLLIFIFELFYSEFHSSKIPIEILDKLGANSRFRVVCDHEYYRLLTFNLLHGSFLHLLMNIFAQIVITAGIECSWGTGRYLVVFFASGVIGGIWSDIHMITMTVGSSACIYGVLAGHVFFMLLHWEQSMKKLFMYWGAIAFLLLIVTFWIPNMDHLSHFGGAIMGIATSMLLFANRIERRAVKVLVFITAIFLTIAITIVPLFVIHSGREDLCRLPIVFV